MRRLYFEALEARLPMDAAAGPVAAASIKPADSQPVEVSGNTLRFTGTGSDLVQLWFVSQKDFWAYYDGNAVAEYLVGTGDDPPGGLNLIDNIDFNGGGGQEQAELIDAFNTYTDTVDSSYSQLVGSNGLTITTYACPYQYYYGIAGSTVTFSDQTDTAGVNSFVGTTDYSIMYYGADDHSFIEAFGPTNVTANSYDPAKDVAYFYVSSSSVTVAAVTMSPGFGTASFNNDFGDSVNQTANGFNTMLAIGNGTTGDKLNLIGAATGTNTYCATQFYSYMSGPGYFDVGEFFGFSIGTSKNFASDYDYLYAPAGTPTDFNNLFTGGRENVIDEIYDPTSSNIIYYKAVGFQNTLAVGNSLSAGGATLNTGNGTGVLFASGSYALLNAYQDESESSGYFTNTSVTGFETVDAQANSPGNGEYLLSSYSFALQFSGSWTKLSGSM